MKIPALPTACALCASVAFVACSTSPREDLVSHGETRGPLVAPQATTIIPGYAHAYEKSHFHIGGEAHPVSVGDSNLMVGSEGAFIVHPNGAVFAVPNGGSSAEAAPPLSTDVGTHNAAVKAYFLAAGLPSDQLDIILIRSTMTD
jgi:hypothetical protein